MERISRSSTSCPLRLMIAAAFLLFGLAFGRLFGDPILSMMIFLLFVVGSLKYLALVFLLSIAGISFVIWYLRGGASLSASDALPKAECVWNTRWPFVLFGVLIGLGWFVAVEGVSI